MSIQSTGLSDHESGALAADRVYSLAYFADVVGISLPTLRRLINRGVGPQLTKLSERRIGVRGRHGTAWLDGRARSAA
jgi:predicted DNA-binding transcriptional regulator AlpA